MLLLRHFDGVELGEHRRRHVLGANGRAADLQRAGNAFGGRLADGQLTRVELEFDDCEDDSSRRVPDPRPLTAVRISVGG